MSLLWKCYTLNILYYITRLIWRRYSTVLSVPTYGTNSQRFDLPRIQAFFYEKAPECGKIQVEDWWSMVSITNVFQWDEIVAIIQGFKLKCWDLFTFWMVFFKFCRQPLSWTNLVTAQHVAINTHKPTSTTPQRQWAFGNILLLFGSCLGL
jgi:hypothetical protein